MIRTRRMGKRPGHYLMTCDLSGFVGWDDEMRKTWDGKFVLKQFWESRHPQDFVRGRKDDQSVPNARPEGEDVFLCEGVYESGVLDANDLIYVRCV